MLPETIWVFPELNNNDAEISKLSLGLLAEAGEIVAKVGGMVIAIAFGDEFIDHSKTLGEYGVSQVYFFKGPLLEYFSSEAYASAILHVIRQEKPWLFLMGDTAAGRELAPRLAALLNAGLVTGCVSIDLSEPEKPVFYRPVYAGQLYQEIELEADRTMLVTMDPAVLNVKPAAVKTHVETRIIEAKLSPGSIRTRHLELLPAEFQKVDVAEAKTIVAAGMGAVDPDLFPLIEELAALLEGSIGTTRPVIDSGKIPRERMIGQTGRVVNPDFYLALGISGASHHVGGIQDSKKIVAVNRDPAAPIFRNADFGLVADLRDVLPELIAGIRKAKIDGEIL